MDRSICPYAVHLWRQSQAELRRLNHSKLATLSGCIEVSDVSHDLRSPTCSLPCALSSNRGRNQWPDTSQVGLRRGCQVAWRIGSWKPTDWTRSNISPEATILQHLQISFPPLSIPSFGTAQKLIILMSCFLYDLWLSYKQV